MKRCSLVLSLMLTATLGWAETPKVSEKLLYTASRLERIREARQKAPPVVSTDPTAAPKTATSTTATTTDRPANTAMSPVTPPPITATTPVREAPRGMSVVEYAAHAGPMPRDIRHPEPIDNTWIARPEPSDTITPRFTTVAAWRPAISGSVDTLGMHLDLGGANDFHTQNNFHGRVAHRLNNRWHLDGGVTNVENRGSLDQAVSFDGLAYGAGSAVSLKTRTADGAVHFTCNRTQHATCELLAGYFWGRSDLAVEQMLPGGKRSGTWEQHYHLGFIGAAAEANIARNAWLRGSLRASPFGTKESGGRMTDAAGSLLLGRMTSGTSTLPAWYIDLGYRYVNLDGSSNGGAENLKYQGPTFGILMEY